MWVYVSVWFGRVTLPLLLFSMTLHPDRNEPVVASAQLAGLTPDAKVSYTTLCAGEVVKQSILFIPHVCVSVSVCSRKNF